MSLQIAQAYNISTSSYCLLLRAYSKKRPSGYLSTTVPWISPFSCCRYQAPSAFSLEAGYTSINEWKEVAVLSHDHRKHKTSFQHRKSLITSLIPLDVASKGKLWSADDIPIRRNFDSKFSKRPFVKSLLTYLCLEKFSKCALQKGR